MKKFGAWVGKDKTLWWRLSFMGIPSLVKLKERKRKISLSHLRKYFRYLYKIGKITISHQN